MSIIRTGDPVRDAANYDFESDYYRELYEQGNADCAICGRLIRDREAYVIDSAYPVEECICGECMAVQKQILQRSGMYGLLREALSNFIDDMRTDTPHDEEKEGFNK